LSAGSALRATGAGDAWRRSSRIGASFCLDTLGLFYSALIIYNNLMESQKPEFILSRHAKKVEKSTRDNELSENYPGITKEGEKEAREKTREIKEIIENLPQEAVVILSGISKAIRTRSTLEIYGDELKNNFKNREDITFVSNKDESSNKEKSLNKKLEELRNLSKFEGKKTVILFPLWIKQFTAPQGKWKEWSDYFSKTGINKDSEIAQWIDVKKGPDPKEVAEDLLVGLQRLEDFFQKFFKGRPIIILNVDHGGELDALFTYLANEGKLTSEGFKKIGNREAQESELARLSYLPGQGIEFNYRGNKFLFKGDEKSEI